MFCFRVVVALQNLIIFVITSANFIYKSFIVIMVLFAVAIIFVWLFSCGLNQTFYAPTKKSYSNKDLIPRRKGCTSTYVSIVRRQCTQPFIS